MGRVPLELEQIAGRAIFVRLAKNKQRDRGGLLFPAKLWRRRLGTLTNKAAPVCGLGSCRD